MEVQPAERVVEIRHSFRAEFETSRAHEKRSRIMRQSVLGLANKSAMV